MTKKQALIIEDHVEIGEIYKLTVEMLGYEAEQITDGQTALERLEQMRPDLIILDMNLPHVSGHYIYKRIAADPAWNDVSVIISTANTLVAKALSGEIRPNDRLLVKPVSPRDLQHVLETLGDRA